MTTDSQSQRPTPPNAARPPSRNRFGWRWPAIVAGLTMLIAGGFWWNWHRPENCYRRGRNALTSGDRETVLRESARLIDTPGFEPHGRLLAGLLLMRSGRPQKALPELSKAAEEEATAVEAMTVAAECYYMMGQFPEAVHFARAALAKDPAALEARRWLAAAYYDLGATVDTALELETISAKDPQDARSERLLGLIGKDTENFGKAVQHYRESLRRDPNPTDRQEILRELAECLVRLSRFDEALDTLNEVNRTAAALTLKAECAQNLGRTDKAEEQLHDAITLDPTYVPSHLKLGTLLLSLGRVDEAVSVLREAVRLAPQISQPHLQLSQAYGLLGKRDAAARELKLMQHAQDIEREFAQLHVTASEDPNNVDVRYRVGVLALKLRKPDLARLWFRAVLSLQPDHPQARAALVRLDQSTSH